MGTFERETLLCLVRAEIKEILILIASTVDAARLNLFR